MRESLTVLAGLLVLALLAALIGPGFVDWRTYRPQIEARLSTTEMRWYEVQQAIEDLNEAKPGTRAPIE